MIVDQGKFAIQAEALHDLQKVVQVQRLVEGTGLADSINTYLRFKLVEEQNIPTEALEPKQVLQEDPGVTTNSRPLRQSAGNYDCFAPSHSVPNVLWACWMAGQSSTGILA